MQLDIKGCRGKGVAAAFDGALVHVLPRRSRSWRRSYPARDLGRREPALSVGAEDDAAAAAAAVGAASCDDAAAAVLFGAAALGAEAALAVALVPFDW